MLLGKLVRENPALAVGVSLPILVVALFVAAKQVPRLLADSPRYSFLFSDEAHGLEMSRWKVAIDLDERSRLRAQAFLDYGMTNRPRERLFFYDHQTEALREIRIPLPPEPPLSSREGEVGRKPVALEIPELEDLVLHPQRLAPDGYRFVEPDLMNGFFLDLFYGRSRAADPSIRKGAAVVPIRRPEPKGYRLRFYGWVLRPVEKETP